MGSMMLLLQQTQNPSGEIGWVASEFTGLLQLVFILAGILILAYFVLRFAIPKFFGLDNLRAGPMTVVARYALEPRKNLYIVQVGKQFILVGTSEANVQFLTSLDSGNLEAVLAQHSVQTPERSEFSRLLRNWKKSQKP
jgi:flagellar biogenesis protein FliO